MPHPAFGVVTLLSILAVAACAGEPGQEDAGAGASAVQAGDTPVVQPPDTPISQPADTTAVQPADTSSVPGPMIHPRREPVSADTTDRAGTPPGGDGAASPADTATWTIGTASAPARVDVPPVPVLTALRTGTHPEYARMTLEIGSDAPGPPGYRAEYIDRPLTECGSGRQIHPVGDAWLELRLEPAAAHTEAGQPTLGAREIMVDGPLLIRVYRTCNFEGIVTHVMALASPNPFRVLTLSDPWRIVVDVQR